ncbi:MAG: bifunctional sugar-1-phosphate nucleotidylyltransferase/acetyltransferase [Promethearchaeota archaeon]
MDEKIGGTDSSYNVRKVRKAVILAAGEGKRLLPLTSTRPKHLLPLMGKPLLGYTIDYLKGAGINEVLLIVGYLKEKIIEYFGDGTNYGLKIVYKTQDQFLGTANAAALAKDFVSDEPFMLIYGDLLMDQRIFKDCIDLYSHNNEIDGVIALFRVNDPQKFGIIQLDSNNNVVKIIEKPKSEEYGNLANAGVYIFSPEIFGAIENTPKSPRNEYELTDSMQIYVDQGHKLRGMEITGMFWSDVGHPWQLLDANKYLMDNNMNAKIEGTIEEGVTIKGNVYISKGAIIKSGTYIEGPAFIGVNSKIGPNSYIRPYASIGDNVHIGNSSEIKNTIILNNTNLAHLSYVGDSIIGENVNFGAGSVVSNVRLDKSNIYMNIKGKRTSTGRKKMGAVIGDNVQLGINSLIMVGIKIGAGSRIGAGTIVTEDVDENTLVYVKQEQIKKEINQK